VTLCFDCADRVGCMWICDGRKRCDLRRHLSSLLLLHEGGRFLRVQHLVKNRSSASDEEDESSLGLCCRGIDSA